MITPVPSSSAFLAVGAASAQFDLELAADAFYVLVADVPLWIAQGANPTASAGAGSMRWPANVPLQVAGACGAKVAAIRASGDGAASLTRLRV